MFDRFDHLPEPVDEPEAAMIEAKDPTGADLAALVQLIGRLEARAEQLARTAVASRFDAPNPAARMHGRADLGADGTITTVFESIERLNNVAAALARAGDAERLRRAAH
jgi:hypothetical protein